MPKVWPESREVGCDWNENGEVKITYVKTKACRHRHLVEGQKGASAMCRMAVESHKSPDIMSDRWPMSVTNPDPL